MHKYMKADAWMGKHLDLHIGRGQKTVADGEVLEGPKWARFVGMGFLKKISADDAAKAAKAPPPPPERKPMLSRPQPPEGLTKAPKAPAHGRSTSTAVADPVPVTKTESSDPVAKADTEPPAPVAEAAPTKTSTRKSSRKSSKKK